MLGKKSVTFEGLKLTLNFWPNKHYGFHGIIHDHSTFLNGLDRKYNRDKTTKQMVDGDAPGSLYYNKKFLRKSVHVAMKPEYGKVSREEYLRVHGGLEGMALHLLGEHKALGKHAADVFGVEKIDTSPSRFRGFIGVPSIYQHIGSIIALKNHKFPLDLEIGQDIQNGSPLYWAKKCFDDAGVNLGKYLSDEAKDKFREYLLSLSPE